MNLSSMLVNTRMEIKDLGLKAIPEPQLVYAANEGQAELVRIMRQAREDFFLATVSDTMSVATKPSPTDITLPSDFFELKDITVTTSGYESVGFIHLDKSDVRFHQALNEGGSVGNGQGSFYYDIIGLGTLRFAPGTNLQLSVDIDYIKQVADMSAPGDSPSDIPAELHYFIVTWMVAESLRSLGDQRLVSYEKKLSDQRTSVIQSVNARQIREPVFVTGYMEEEEAW